jgi:hypothetical protein
VAVRCPHRLSRGGVVQHGDEEKLECDWNWRTCYAGFEAEDCCEVSSAVEFDLVSRGRQAGSQSYIRGTSSHS